MTTPYPCHILLVSPDAPLIHTIEDILADKEITPIQVDTAIEAIDVIQSHSALFSLVIVQQKLVQQKLKNMEGLQLLEKVKGLCRAMRILVTKGFDNDLLANAVNHRLVHKYISDSGDIQEVSAVIESAIRRFNRLREDEELFALAKKQNKRLYELNCQYVELNRSHNREIGRMNLQIESVRNTLQYIREGHPDKLQALVQDIITFAQKTPHGQKNFDALFSGVLSVLNQEFSLLQKQGSDGHGQ